MTGHGAGNPELWPVEGQDLAQTLLSILHKPRPGGWESASFFWNENARTTPSPRTEPVLTL